MKQSDRAVISFTLSMHFLKLTLTNRHEASLIRLIASISIFFNTSIYYLKQIVGKVLNAASDFVSIEQHQPNIREVQVEQQIQRSSLNDVSIAQYRIPQFRRELCAQKSRKRSMVLQRLYNVYWMRGAKPNRQSICTPFDSDGNEIIEHTYALSW